MSVVSSIRRSAPGATAVIIGGSISGLAIAIALARLGANVEILERDMTPDPDLDDSNMERWWRRGIPQARHSHTCLALGRKLLKTHAPEILAALLAAGAQEIPSGARLSPDGQWSTVCDDEDLVALACRRPLFEAVLRRHACERPGVSFRNGVEVTGLVTTGSDVPVVRGLTTSDGHRPADVVIDASGRTSGLPGWLRQAGAQPPQRAGESCGILYFSRFYRLRRYPSATVDRGPASGGIGPATACVAIPADNGTVSVTIGVPPGDRQLRQVATQSAFEEVARLHPAVAPWLAPGIADPISQIAPMAGLNNRLRRLLVDGRPIVAGLFTVGDAACITDPAFGRGISLGLVHAFALADAIADSLDHLENLATLADGLTQRVLQPWFEDSIAMDRARRDMWAGRPPPASGTRPTANEIAAAAAHDPRAWRTAMRRFNLLDHPDTIFNSEAVVNTVCQLRAAGETAPPTGPRRDDILQTIAEVKDCS